MSEKLSPVYARVSNSADPKLEENMQWEKLINTVPQIFIVAPCMLLQSLHLFQLMHIYTL